MLLLALAFLIAVPAQAASFDFERFFLGKTRGEGELKVLLRPTKRITVDSEGSVQKDGTLVLTQIVNEPGTEPRERQWRLKRVNPTRLAGSLTDAAGPVSIDLVGERARIRYTMKNRMSVEQWLTPAGDKIVLNRMKVRRLGLVVAHFDETIRKLD